MNLCHPIQTDKLAPLPTVHSLTGARFPVDKPVGWLRASVVPLHLHLVHIRQTTEKKHMIDEPLPQTLARLSPTWLCIGNHQFDKISLARSPLPFSSHFCRRRRRRRNPTIAEDKWPGLAIGVINHATPPTTGIRFHPPFEYRHFSVFPFSRQFHSFAFHEQFALNYICSTARVSDEPGAGRPRSHDSHRPSLSHTFLARPAPPPTTHQPPPSMTMKTVALLGVLSHPVPPLYLAHAF